MLFVLFSGNNEVGTGTLTITNVIPNKRVDLLLDMTSPMTAHNNITYTLIPEANGTRFTWSMHGDGGWMFKIVQVRNMYIYMLMSCLNAIEGMLCS